MEEEGGGKRVKKGKIVVGVLIPFKRYSYHKAKEEREEDSEWTSKSFVTVLHDEKSSV